MSLHLIAKEGTSDQLEEYLRSHPANAPDDLSNALSAAIMREDIGITILLLEHGASPNCQPREHMPPLHCAVEQLSSELVEVLCRYGADVNYPNENGFTPLHLAVDAEADTAWQLGETPSGAMAQQLLTLGANPTAKDVTGSTPLSIAKKYRFSRAIELFQMNERES